MQNNQKIIKKKCKINLRSKFKYSNYNIKTNNNN